VASGTQHEVDLHVDGPWDEGARAERRQQPYGELVSRPLLAVARGDERPRVADDQSASRESTSSTRSERSGSSSITPA
jgi:hypothetical protein